MKKSGSTDWLFREIAECTRKALNRLEGLKRPGAGIGPRVREGMGSSSRQVEAPTFATMRIQERIREGSKKLREACRLVPSGAKAIRELTNESYNPTESYQQREKGVHVML